MKYFFLCSLFLFVWKGLFADNTSVKERFTLEGYAQGTTYNILYYAESERISKDRVDSLLHVIDLSMSTYLDTSIISRFNTSSCTCIAMDDHMRQVVQKSFEIYRKSGGIFDITVKPLVDLWGFGRVKVQHEPDSTTIKKVLSYVGMDKLYMPSKNILCKSDSLVQIDLNGIAQGYSVDILADLLEAVGVESYLVELGGEIRTKGVKPDNSRFTVAIFSPKSVSNDYENVLDLYNKAITTSGSYENVRKFSDKTISHHINPVTGYPVGNQIISVTVVAPSAMDSDGWDNVFITLSPKVAVTLANKQKKIDIYILYLENGEVRESMSKGFRKYLKPS